MKRLYLTNTKADILKTVVRHYKDNHAKSIDIVNMLQEIEDLLDYKEKWYNDKH